MSTISRSSSPELNDNDSNSAESASSTFDDFICSKNNNKNHRKSTKNKKKKDAHLDKVDIMFEDCHWYDIPCPYPSCYEKGIRFDNHDKFKLHHEQTHCPRGENGDIDRAKDSLRWQCPVMTTKIVDGREFKIRCNKISNSWYNYAGHITSHKEIGHGWGCALPPEGKRKKTNRKHPKFNHMIVCGKRTSTKHHLLAHMNNVHKSYNVIDANGRQYNKKKDRKSKSKSNSTTPINSRKRKLMEANEDEMIFSKNNKKNKHRNNRNRNARNNGNNNTSLLQMPLPQFPKLSTISPFMSTQHGLFAHNNHSILAQTLAMNNLLPLTTTTTTMSPFHSKNMAEPPSLKRLRPNPPSFPPMMYYNNPHQKNRLIPTSQGKQCSNQDIDEQYQFLSLLCRAAHSHDKGCDECNGIKLDLIKTEEHENENHDDNDIEASLPSLPSLSAYNSNQSMPSTFNTSSIASTATSSTNNSPSTISENTINTQNNGTHSLELPKFPRIQSMNSIFPNLLMTNHSNTNHGSTQTITNSVPFTFDLNQLCSANNGTATHSATLSSSTRQKESADPLENGVITTAIPSIPVIPSIPTFPQTFK